MDNFIYFYQGGVDSCYVLFLAVEDEDLLVGHIGFIEFDWTRAYKFIGEEDGEGELGLVIISVQDGIAVVSLLIRGNEVGTDLFLGSAYFYSKGGDVFEITWF